jgi:ATP/maltotriose-dependent transcriptional regulator MalT
MARGGIREAYLLGVSLSLLGHIHTFRGEYASAREYYHRTIALLTAPDARDSLYAAKQALARLEIRSGNVVAAIPILIDCLEQHARQENPTWIRAGLVDSAWLAHLLDDNLRAARLFGAAGVSGPLDLDFPVADAVAPVLLAVRERLGERDERTHHRIGRATPRDDVIRETLAWLDSIAAQNDPLAGANDSILSQREREVLARMAQGESNRQIAAALYIASSTVDTHAKRILRKLGTQSRAGAVAAGFHRGLIDTPDS